MYEKIIICLALSHGFSQSALDVARSLRRKGGRVLAVHVYEPPHSSVQTFLNEDAMIRAKEAARDLLEARMGGAPDIDTILLTGHAGRAITDFAAQEAADCIIVGSHKPGLRDYFLGSTAARIVRYAPCAVHVLR